MTPSELLSEIERRTPQGNPPTLEDEFAFRQFLRDNLGAFEQALRAADAAKRFAECFQWPNVGDFRNLIGCEQQCYEAEGCICRAENQRNDMFESYSNLLSALSEQETKPTEEQA